MRLEFRLLGDIAMLADGQPLELGGTRQRSVLALLMLQRDHPVATELLADRLWPDDQPLTAIKTIQVYVSRIRRALGPHADRLSSSATGYRLAVADDEIDAARFERGLRQAREALAGGSADAALAGLEESLAQWSGPALGDLAGEQFARREAERLEELRLQALEELYELRINGGSGRNAIGELRRLLADQPGRERLWRLLMLALYADGRQGEALQAYQDARRYLAEELGLDPGQELRDLEGAILAQEAPQPRQTILVPEAADHRTDSDPIPALGAPEAESVGRRTRRVVTVLRADIDQPSEGDLDPEILDSLGARALDVVRRAVERHGGTIDGADHDGLTALFGLTVAREDDSLRAVRAAFELTADETVVLRVGISTGEVLARPREGAASMVAGVPLQHAMALAARASSGEVLLGHDTERLVRALASTERVHVESTDALHDAGVVRVLALGDPDAAPRTTTRFVGRRRELDSLLGAFQQVVETGGPGLATVLGVPGVGKSRLVAESFARITERASILRSRCLPYGDGITYWPIRELVLAATGIAPGEPRDIGLAKLDSLISGFPQADLVRSRVAAVIGLTDEAVPGEEIPWAARRFFEALAAERPLVLLVDDLQWAEPALIDLLEHVLNLGRGPMLLVTVARPELGEERPEWLGRPGLLVRLDALDDADAAILLNHLAPELPRGPVRSRIVAAAEGNPLFVEQFVAYASDEDLVGRRGLDRRSPSELSIPPTIGALLAARLDRIPDIQRRLLERAAVVGRTFWSEALGELLSDSERAELPRHLAQLARRELIRPERSDVAGHEAYRFRHLLIRDAAYASLPKRERASLHERFAGWLGRHPETKAGEYDLILAYHLEQAYEYRVELGDDRGDARRLAERALDILAPAGHVALDRGDPHAAVSLLRRAANLSPTGPGRTGLLIRLRSALRTAGEPEASDAVDAEVVGFLADHPDEGLEYLRWVTEASWMEDATIPEAQAACAYYERVGDGIGMIRALEVAATTHAIQGQLTQAAEIFDQATKVALEIGRPDRAATISAHSVWIFPEGLTPIPAAIDRCRRCLELAGSNGESRARTLIALGRAEARTGIRDRWRRHFEEAKVIIDDLGLLPLGAGPYPINLGEAEVVTGEPARVADMLRESCSTLLDVGGSQWLSSLAPVTAQALLAVRRLDEVEHYALWGRDLASPNDVDAQAKWRMAMAGLRSQQGRHDEAVTLARETVAVLAASEYELLMQQAEMTLAGALRAAGDEAGAMEAAHAAQRRAMAKQDEAGLRIVATFLAVDG